MPEPLQEGDEPEHPSDFLASGQSEHPASEVGTPDFPQLFGDEESVDLQEYDLCSEADREILQPDVSDRSSGSSDILVAMSDRSWTNFATSMIVTSENKRLKTLMPWDLQKVGKFQTPSDTMAQFLSFPSSSLSILSEPHGEDLEPKEAAEARERLTVARKVRISRSDDDLRDASISKLRKIILLDPKATRLGELLVSVSGKPLSDLEKKRSIEQAFPKSPQVPCTREHAP